MSERPPRLGDVIEDYCPRCRLLLDHDVASLFDDQVAKVTCRTCHNTHDYRHGKIPTRRKKPEDRRQLMDQVLEGMGAPPQPVPPQPPPPQRKRRDLWAEVERLNKKK